MPESDLSTQKPKRPELDIEDKIAKAEALIKKWRNAQRENTRKVDTRKKVIVGAALLKAFERDSDLKLVVLPALKVVLDVQDFELVFGNVGDV